MTSSRSAQKELWWGYCKMTALAVLTVGALMMAPTIYDRLIGDSDGTQDLISLLTLISPWVAGFIALYNGWVAFYLSMAIGTSHLTIAWWVTIISLVGAVAVLVGFASHALVGLLVPLSLALGLIVRLWADSR